MIYSTFFMDNSGWKWDDMLVNNCNGLKYILQRKKLNKGFDLIKI